MPVQTQFPIESKIHGTPMFDRIMYFVASATFLMLTTCHSVALAQEAPNVLLIAIDDLNDWVGCLAEHPNARTPSIDAPSAWSMASSAETLRVRSPARM